MLIPDSEKWKVISHYQSIFPVDKFIETGTSTGDTTAALYSFFKQLFTIELHYDTYLQAVMRFIDDPKVTVIQGDSDKVLQRLLRHTEGPFVFWLDAHENGLGTGHAGPCPVMHELKHIMYSPAQHIILIDDARYFGVEPGWPTIEEIRAFLGGDTHPDWEQTYDVDVIDDIIRCTPK